ncbi:MAG: DUF177 domain-containing protein [Pseudomonadota bacterium]
MMIEEERPFTLPINVRTLPKRGRVVNFEANADEAAAIAAENDLVSVEAFSATATVQPWKGQGVAVTGRVRASVTQPCAVTGEPVNDDIEEEVEMIFVPQDSKLAKPRLNEEGEWVLSVEGDDPPETFVGDSIDLATIWLEHFTLGLDPFLRAEGARFEPGPEDLDDADESPFAALAALKTSQPQ